MTDFLFWKGKRVFLTGHTGFKGSWLSIWLSNLGAEVAGYALAPNTEPDMFSQCHVESLLVRSDIADIRKLDLLKDSVRSFEPEIVLHLAAQPLVKASYKDPVETYSTNVMGTVNLLEAVRETESVKSVVVVTTDKCYEDQRWVWGYRENDRLGGFDPYANSKACAELVVSSYTSSFFNSEHYAEHGVAIATARAGNVVGGGDYAAQRLVPDCVKAFKNGETVTLRNPGQVRPWQHVLDPLSGYLALAEKLHVEGSDYNGGWNFGPPDAKQVTVLSLTKALCDSWFADASYRVADGVDPDHETQTLTLNSSKAMTELKWRPVWGVEQTVEKISAWEKVLVEGGSLLDITREQIGQYMDDVN